MSKRKGAVPGPEGIRAPGHGYSAPEAKQVQHERVRTVVDGLRWATRIGAVAIVAAGIFNIAAFVQTGAWQMLVVLGGMVVGASGLAVAARLVSRGRLEAARNIMLAAMVVAFASGELMHSGLTWYLGVGGVVLILLMGLVLVPGRWWTWVMVAASYAGFVVLVNWLQPLPRYDVRQLGIGTNVFIFALLGFLIVAALFLVARFYQRLVSIRVRLPVSFALVVLGSVGLIASVGAVVGSQGGRRQALTQLGSVATMKEAEIDQWIGRVETALDDALAGGQLTSRMVLILETPNPTDTELFYPRNYLQYAADGSEYFDDFALLDRDGNVRLSTAVAPEVAELVGEADLYRGLEGFYLQPLPLEAPAASAAMVAMRPIVDDGGQAIGVLMGIVDAGSLGQLLGERAWLGSTGEMYLIDRSQRLLTDLRFSPVRQPEGTRGVVNTQLESLGVATQADASMVYRDYRGERVVGVSRWLPQLDATLIAKQDVAESTAVTNDLLRVIVLVSLGALVAALSVSMFMTRSITGPLAELTETADRIAGGDLSLVSALGGPEHSDRGYSAPRQRDEIGTLSRAFASMTTQLRELIASLERRVAERTHELERRSTYLEASAEVGRAATSILDPEQLMREVVELIRERFGLYYVGLFMVEAGSGSPEAGWAVLRAGTGLAGALMLERGHRIRLGTGIIGWSIAHAQAAVASEAAVAALEAPAGLEAPAMEATKEGRSGAWGASSSWAMRLATPELPETRSEAALPLRSRGHVLGAITVQDTRPAAFDEDMLAVLQTMADQVAVAIDNAHLFEQRQQALDAEQQAYGQISRQAWLRMIESTAVKGYRCDETGVAPASDALHPLSQKAVAERRVLVTEPVVQRTGSGNPVGRDAGGNGGSPGEDRQVTPEGTRVGAEIAAPIVVRGPGGTQVVLGVLHFRKGETDHAPWSREQIALVEGLAEQLGQALESARLYQDSQLRAARERLIGEVTARMRESLDMDAVLRTATQQMRQALELHDVTIRLEGASTQGEEDDGS